MSLKSRRPLLFLAGGLVCVALGGCVSDGIVLVEGHVNNAVSMVAPPKGEPVRVPLFVASTRRGDGAAEKDGNAHFSLIAVSVPPGHRAGAVERPSFGSSDPKRHFMVTDRSKMDEPEFLNEIATHVSGRVGISRDILLYVHGFNTNLEEARFRLAQITSDGRFSGVPILFTWNTRGGLFNYESDKESATVARDALEKLILDLSHTPGVGRIHILAHSMGAWLTMESLRSISISGHPDLDGKLGDVMLAAPDIDLNVFRQQVARLDPKHVSIFVASDDRALSLSSRIAGDRPRLGALDPTNPRDKGELDRLGVAVHDISGLSSDFVGHGAYAEAPTVVRQIGAQLTAPRQADANAHAIIDAGSRETSTDPTPTSSTAPSVSANSPSSGAIETQPLPPLAK
jgi:esterase/lipase superfamily enzyme